MPGAPCKASTSSPESSATAALPLADAAWRALSRALAMKLLPVSRGDGSLRSARLANSNGNPASRVRNSRSLPGFAVATMSRRGIPLSSAGLELGEMQLCNALRRKVQELIELMTAKGMAFRGALDLDERASAIHHHIHVRFRVRILGIVQIEHRRAAVNADGHRGDLAVQRI